MIPWWAVFPVIQGIAIVSALAILYGVLLRRLATIAEPYRFQLAERGEKYLALCDNPKEKSQIRFYLDNAFNPWIAFAACFFLWLALFMVAAKKSANDFEPTSVSEHEQIANLFTLSVFAANPLFGAVVTVEMVLVTVAVVLIAGNFALVRRVIGIMLEAQARRRGNAHLHAH